MDIKHPHSLRQSCLWLSLVMLTSLTSSLTAQPSRAQVVESAQTRPQTPPPQDVLPPEPEPIPIPIPSPEPPQPLPPPGDLLRPPTPTPTPSEGIPSNLPGTINVKKFEVVGSTVFSQERLAEVLAPFTNRPLELTELFQARSAITQLYIEEGYITSGAYIPPQTLQGGVVKIQVVEGGLEDIQVTGTEELNPNYVRSRIALATEPPLKRERLLEALQLLQLNPLIANLSAELSAGTRPGTSLLEVRVREAQTSTIQVVLDNGRVPSVGSFRRRVQFNEANLLGQGDGLSAVYTNTEGSNALDASYAWPLNPRNGTLTLSYGLTSSEVIEEPFDELNIEGDSRYYELTLRQPVIENPTEVFALGLTASRRESDISSLIEDPFGGPPSEIPPSDLSPGADEEGRTRISALQFFQEWTQRNSREVIAARSQFSLGVGALDATINADPEPDSRFFAWRGQAQWVRLLAPDTLLTVRGDVQLASTVLVPLEQFGLGGLESVRGYRQDYLLTDNGAFASAEVRLPILRVPELDSVLQIAPFVDVGTAWNNESDGDESDRGDVPGPNTLVSVGLGLRWQQGDRFTVRLDWGIPLVDVDDSGENTLQENGLYFSVFYNPF